MKHLVFTDDNSNKMELYPNKNYKLYIEIGTDDYDQKYIVLDKSDVIDLINELQMIIEKESINDE